MYVRIYVCMYVCMYVRTYVCMYVCMYVRMYVCTYVRMYVCTYVCMYVCTVHDTENLTFSAEFRDCSARNDAEFPHGCRGTSARAPRNFRAG